MGHCQDALAYGAEKRDWSLWGIGTSKVIVLGPQLGRDVVRMRELMHYGRQDPSHGKTEKEQESYDGCTREHVITDDRGEARSVG